MDAAGLASLFFRDLFIALLQAPQAITMMALSAGLKTPLHVVALAVVVAIGFTVFADLTSAPRPDLMTFHVQAVFIGLGLIAALIWGFVGWSATAGWRRRQRDKAAAAK
jgi:hypothetical protein